MCGKMTTLVILFAFLLGNCWCYEDLRFRRKACSKYGTPIQPSNRVNSTSRLIELRDFMSSSAKLGDLPIDALFITTDDDHQSEYVAEFDKRLEFISGFSGSYARAIVTATQAILWTDGRFHLQADDQMNCDWLLMREGHRNIPSPAEWLQQNLPHRTRIGADPRLISHAMWSNLEQRLRVAEQKLVPLEVNPIDKIWVKGRPPQRNKHAFIWDIKYAGKNWTTKVEETRVEIQKLGANAMIVTALDEIAWLLNIRGRDIPCNPFVRSYIILTMEEIILYVNSSQLVKNNVASHLSSMYGANPTSVKIRKYSAVWTDLPTIAQKCRFLLPSTCAFSPGSSQAIYSLIQKKNYVAAPSPIIFLKAQKNPTEARGMETAHIRDAVVMIKFLSYVERWFSENSWTEIDIVKILDQYRYENELSLGNSFTTVAAFGPNGAHPKYEPTPNTNAVIFDNSTLVIDSGGQYYDGTTDITRTLHMGQPTDDEKQAYTRVLMGLIQLSSLTFPANMYVSIADAIARTPVWEAGLDYLHITGHGIGAFLAVRESPIALDYKETDQQYFKPGYFFSSEPGYYRENEFGVRLENVLEVIEKPWLHVSGQAMYGFKEVTLVPYEPKLIDFSLLSFYHRKWLNEYNARIRIIVGEELKKQNNTEAFFWMMEKTNYIPEYGHSDILRSKSMLLLLINVILCNALINILY